MDTILTVRNEHLSLLSPQQAVALFRELLWAEATRIGVPLGSINVSSWINVPDGGVDASIDTTQTTVPSNFVRDGYNGYQIKAGSAFSPWQQKEIQRELFGEKTPARENLHSRVRDCLDRNGTYVLVCFGQDLVEQQLIDAVGHLENYFKGCEYENPKVDVWSLNNLISFLRPFPALALRVNHRSTGAFETHGEWATHEDMRYGFVAGEKQRELISIIQQELRNSTHPIHIRVWGDAGIGKSRLVLEATDTDDLRPLVIYSSAGRFRDSDLMGEVLREEFQAILILDECDPNTRAYIWNKLQYHSPRIKIISVHNEMDNCSGITPLDVPPLGEDQIREIIAGYGIPEDQVYSWARECSGSPRVAHVVGSNLSSHPEDLLMPSATVNIWERYIVGLDDPNSEEVQQRRTVLRHLALFKRFGYGQPVAAEARAIAGLVMKADPRITWPRFQEIIRTLRNRKILQGETTLYITPKLLHIKLWLDWWDTYGEGFSPEELASLPPLLLDWFLEMFQYAAGSPAALRTVRTLLGEDGLFQQAPELLRRGLIARFFHSLAMNDPAAALDCLKRTVGTWSREQLLQFTEGRRYVVLALQEVAIWRELFRDAVALLLPLAEAENEPWSNNASGIFADLFSISEHEALSRTEASPQERFPVLRETLASESKERRLLALRACDRALAPVLWGPVIESTRLLGKVPKLWVPETYGEMFDAYRQIWGFLIEKMDGLPEDERREAARILIDNARSVGRWANLSSMVIDTLRELSKKPYMDKQPVLEKVIQVLRYDGDHLADEVRSGWEQLKRDLTGTSFASLLERFVKMSIFEDEVDKEGNQVDQVQTQLEELAQQAIDRSNLLHAELGWLVTDEARNGARFGYELGKRDSHLSLLAEILEAQKSAGGEASVYFLGGYLRVLSEQDRQRWEALMDMFSEDPGLMGWVPELSWRSGELTDRAALRILNLLKGGVTEVGHLRMFIYGGAIRELSENVFTEWIEFLLSRSEARAVIIALTLYSQYYLANDSQHKLPEELTLRLLASPILFQETKPAAYDQMDSYHWMLIGKAFVILYPTRSLELTEIMLQHLGVSETILGGLRSHPLSLFADVARQHSTELWGQIARHLGPPITLRAYFLRDLLRGHDDWGREQEGLLALIPPEVVWQWVDEDVERRGPYLASFVPKLLFREEGKICWAREVLIRYGGRESVRRSLFANFSTEGWSGSESLHLREKRQQLLAFREAEQDHNVNRWINEYAVELTERIERAKIKEERED